MATYRGSFGEQSNKAHWVSQVFTMTHETTGEDADLSDAALDVEIELVIRKEAKSSPEFSALLSDGDGKIVLSGGGFMWSLEPDDLSDICSGTYFVGVKVTIDEIEYDVIAATVAIFEGV